MVTLRGVIDSILQKYGYDVIVRDGIIEAEAGGKRICIAILDESPSFEGLLRALAARKGARAIASLADLTQSQLDEAVSKGVEVWSRREIEEELGAAVVTHLEAEKGGLFAMLAVGDLDALRRGGSLPLMVEGGESPEKVLKPSLTLSDVKEISSKTTGGYKFELELVPYYFYDYFCIVKISGIESPDKRAGTIGVNALTGDAQPWAALPEVVSELGEPHVRLEPKVQQQDSDAVAMAKVISMHTEEVERVVEKGHARIFDKVIVKPERGDVTLNPRGLLYVPMWCVEGLHGVMVLNAVTAKVVSEEYYRKADGSGKSA
jgi:hypothetical protein